MNELLVIKDKVSGRVNRWTSGRVACNKRQDNIRTVLIQNESVSKIKYPFQMQQFETTIIKPYLPPIFKVNMAYFWFFRNME